MFSYSGEVTYYLPAGTWTNWFTGERVRVVNGAWRTEVHGYDSIPLWVRDGSIVVSHPDAEAPEYEYGKDALVSVFLEQISAAEVTVSEEDGGSVVFTARRVGERIEIASSDGRAFRARLGFGAEVAALTDGLFCRSSVPHAAMPHSV